MSAARFLSSLAAVALLVACSGGPGTGGTINVEPREPPGKSGSPEAPGGAGSPEPTSGGPDTPGGDSGAPSSSGGTSSGGTSACPACDQDYDCTIAGQNVTVTVALATTDKGQCVIIGTADVFSCDGEITVNNQMIPWTAYGDGGFTVDDQGQQETCLPIN